VRGRKGILKLIVTLFAVVFAVSFFIACDDPPNGNGGYSANKTALQNLYNQARIIDDSLYTEPTVVVFKAAFQRAKQVLDKADATQTEVDGAHTDLLSAIGGLVQRPPPSGVVEIRTVQELNNITMSGNYRLEADLVLTNTPPSGTTAFLPLGSSSQPFTGTFDGNGRTISLTLNIATLTAQSDNIFVGLFAVNRGRISNVNIGTLSITGTNSTPGATVLVGGIAARNRNTISNCTVSNGTITVNAGTGNTRYRIGMISGRNNGTIRSSLASGTITATMNSGNLRVGGIAGLNEEGAFTLSNARVNINATSQEANIRAGGLVGQLSEGNATVDRSSASGTVTISSPTETMVAGGLIGYIDATDATIMPNYTVKDSFATGAVTIGAGAGNGYAGGLVGRLENAGYDAERIDILNSYSTGAVRNNATGANIFVAGLVGRIQRTSGSSKVTITNSFTTSSVSAASNNATTSAISNGNAGNTNTPASLQNSFFLTANGAPGAFLGTAMPATTNDLRSVVWQIQNLGESTARENGWLFTTETGIWIQAGNSFPTLRNLPN
jgi:hypothetical protein